MSLFLAKRLATLIATLLFTSVVIFLVLEILPGDPALVMLGVDARPDTLAALHHQLGLDEPALTRYFTWLGALLTGDFGISYAYKVPVWPLIVDRLAITVPLALMAISLAILIGVPLGIYAADRHNKFADVVVMGLSQIGISIPSFWFAILLIMFFAVKLGWFSAGGFAGWDDGPLPALQSLLLPACALAAVQTAIFARITRSAVLEVSREDFVRTARAKGLNKRATLWRHVLRNALIPVVTVVGLQFGALVAGAIVIEQVFSLPGLGRLVFQAISNRDLEIVKAVVVLLASFVICINFLVDLLYVWIDPRLQSRDV